MLKYNDIITKLTDEQKIRILTGVGNISSSDMRSLDIPALKAVYMNDCRADKYPPASALARAWSPELWDAVAGDKVFAMANDNATFAIAPGAKIKFSPYSTQMSEDPYLASSLSASFATAAAGAGMSTGACGYCVTDADVEWMDRHPDMRVLNEYIVRPYRDVAEATGADTLITDSGVASNDYKGSCRYIQGRVSEGTKFLVCEHASEEYTVDYIARGIICFDASASALMAALAEYKKLKKQIDDSEDDSSALTERLKELLAARVAISDEDIDNALNNLFEFVFECANNRRSALLPEEADDALALRATLESTVLLKNDSKILPLSKDKKIGIIGDVAFDEALGQSLASECKSRLESAGYQLVGASRGYDTKNLHNNESSAEALNICRTSDVVLFFCGAGREAEKEASVTRKLTLPPNQLCLADMLGKYKKPMIAIIMSDNSPDVEFVSNFSGALLTPCELKDSAQAICDILTGAYSPTGKLACTLFRNSDRALTKAQVYMKNYGMRSGPFVGYRYYDSERVSVGYPFGYGLSYTEFEYSELSVNANKVSFTVKNIGRVKGAETAQVYIGKPDSSLLRPLKELCGFVKIELEPLEERRVSLDIKAPEVFYNGEFVTEKGDYSVFVGASVSDIRLAGKCFFDGRTLEHDNQRRSDYLQSCCNILEGNYTLEAKYSFMKKLSKNLFIGIGALILAISIAIFNVTTYTSSMFLGIIAAILGICAVAFFVMDLVERNNQQAIERKKINEENEQHFENAEQVAIFSTEKMFNDAFDVKKDDAEDEKPAEDLFIDEDHAEYITPDFRIGDAAAELKIYLAERGFKLNRGVAETIVSSLVTSRLMIFNGLSSEDFNSLMLLISEYFGSVPCVDNAKCSLERNVFFAADEQGYAKKTNILKALQLAANSHEKVQLAAIDGITENNVSDWLKPFTKYLRVSRKRNDIAIFDDNGRNVGYSIGRNLWIVMRLDKERSFAKLPEFVLKNAAVVDVNAARCPLQEERTAYRRITSYQTEYVLNKESGSKEISEDTWKKVDKLEKYAQQHSEYNVGNKLWLDVEKQMDILLACGMEIGDALDAAMATRILPSIVAALEGNLKAEDRTLLQTLEVVLGEGNMQYSKEFVNRVASTPSAADTEDGQNSTEIE